MVSLKEVYANAKDLSESAYKGLCIKAKAFADSAHKVNERLCVTVETLAGNTHKKIHLSVQTFIEKTHSKELYAKVQELTKKITDRFYAQAKALYSALHQKFQPRIKALLQKIQDPFSKYRPRLLVFLSPALLILSKIYAYATTIMSTTCEFLAFIISKTAASIHLIAVNLDILFQYIRRRLYVRKILSARSQWYVNKKGNFYNPKLKVTVYPSWECTWNIAGLSDSYHGYQSKKQAQEVAFKMWMKMRRLKMRLDMGCLDTKIPINLTKRILSNKIQLRKPVFHDIPQLLTLMEPFGHSQTDESMKARIRTYSNKSNYQILVAERGKRIVGFIAFVLYDLFISEGKRCCIEGLVVDAKEQDLTVKRKLIQAAEAFARDNKGAVVDLTADLNHANDGMYDLYKFLGYSNEGDAAKAYLKKELG